ncbi:MAG: MazG family protein [Candidatus Dadabacteria bacterium CSP1-2]|jgi:tetrapyrrole methylase family protein/MazG family protein|nr:MAG: MazG family protein [Candidatus Dadabacteria bacterium CSP1-2]
MKKSFEDLVELSKFLRSPEGCPWDREQTLNTLRTFILEEAHEVIQAIEMNDIEELKEELGDLLYQILFTSQICNEEGKFTVEGVLNQLYYKLIRRHPHVFGEEKAKDAEEAVKRWHGEKLKEKTRKRNLLQIPRSLPALLRAQRVGEKASQVGFDWEKTQDVIVKVKEELEELQKAISSNEQNSIEKEWGDLIFSLVNLARFLKIDAEVSAHKAIDVFIERFNRIEEKAKDMDKTLSELTLKEMDELWEEVKREG